MNPDYRYKAKLVRVIDGDTVVLDVDLGFHMTARITFRLLGIDAPELKTEEGQNTKIWLHQQLFMYHSVLVKSQKPDKYGGRWLGTIYLPPDETSLNETMISKGLAKPYSGGAK